MSQHKITILPHIAHMVAVKDARKAKAEADFDGNSINRSDFERGKYDALVDHFIFLADVGFDPEIPQVALDVYEHAYREEWGRC